MKGFFASKLNWLGLLTLLLGLLQALQGAPLIQEHPIIAAALVSVIGFITVVLRTFATNTEIKNPLNK